MEGKTGGEPHSIETSRSFAAWFDETGRFVAKPFQEYLANAVPAIGRQDPAKVKSASQDLLDANPDLLDAVMAGAGKAKGSEGATAAAATTASTTTAAEPTEKKGKRRKN